MDECQIWNQLNGQEPSSFGHTGCCWEELTKLMYRGVHSTLKLYHTLRRPPCPTPAVSHRRDMNSTKPPQLPDARIWNVLSHALLARRPEVLSAASARSQSSFHLRSDSTEELTPPDLIWSKQGGQSVPFFFFYLLCWAFSFLPL